MHTRSLLILAMALAVITGCGGDNDGGDKGNAICGTAYKTDYVNDAMNEVYYWYREMPQVNSGDYNDMESLLDVLVQPEKDRGKLYTYLTTQAAEQALLSNAGYIGFGFSTNLVGTDRLFFREVFPGGPAADAGIARGDELLAIDGEDVATLIASGAFDENPGPYGPSETGVQRTLTIEKGDGTGQDSVTISKREVTIPTVSYAETFDRVGGDGIEETGYVFFRSFLQPSPDELNQVFGSAEWQDVTRLVLDLRYNGGGLVTVAEHLGSLIAGEEHAGEVLGRQEFNDKNSSYNSNIVLSNVSNSLPITDVVVITTGGTASASELVLNGLEPILGNAKVQSVGDTSYGKPVGQSGITFCEDVLRAVTFRTLNRNGVGDYYTGIEPDCSAEDDITRNFGDPAEASLAEALHVLDNPGSCSAAAPKAQRKMGMQQAIHGGNRTPMYRDGWDVLTGGAR